MRPEGASPVDHPVFKRSSAEWREEQNESIEPAKILSARGEPVGHVILLIRSPVHFEITLIGVGFGMSGINQVVGGARNGLGQEHARVREELDYGGIEHAHRNLVVGERCAVALCVGGK